VKQAAKEEYLHYIIVGYYIWTYTTANERADEAWD